MVVRKANLGKSGARAAKPKRASKHAIAAKNATKTEAMKTKTATEKGPKYAPTRKAPVAGTVSRKKIREAIRSTM